MNPSRCRTALLVLAVAVALGATTWAVREGLQGYWLREFDSSLRREADEVGRVWLRTGSVNCCAPLEASGDQPHGHSGQTYFEIRSPSGTVLARSPLLGRAHWPDLAPGALEHVEWYHDFYLNRMRWIARRLDSAGTGIQVFYARDHGELKQRDEDLDETLVFLGLALVGGIALVPVLKGLLRRRTERGKPPPSMVGRLLVGSIAISGVILSLAGWATYAVVEHGWLAQMDQALENRALGLAALCSKVDGNWRFEGSHLENSVFQDPKSMQYFEARDDQGREIGRSVSLGHLAFPAVELTPGQRRFDWFHPGYLHKTRFVAIRLPGAGQGLTVFFGQDYRDMKSKLRDLREILAGIWIASEILLSGLLGLLVHLSIAPLRKIAQGLESVDELHLGFHAVGAPREVRPLVDALSAALGRLDKAFERERALVADLAHEIRTPMAGIRTTLEVGVGDDEEHARLAMTAALSILARMQVLMDSLLSLARLEGGHVPSVSRKNDLAPLVLEVVEDWRGTCAERGVDLRLDLAPGLPSISNPEWCRVILRNLMDNAVAHAVEASWIALGSESNSGRVRIRISNDGSRLDTSDAAKVFDRFWRKDDARTHEGNHAGLGLALCRQLATRMGGGIEATVPRNGEFQVELDLPMAD